MDRRPAKSTSVARFAEHLPARSILPAVLIPVLLLGGVVLARWYVTPQRVAVLAAGGPADMDPADLADAAATALEQATSFGGGGYRFEIIQTSTMVAKPDGPKIPVPDPSDPHKTLRQADSYYLNALLESGVVRSDGFWSRMRAGPIEGAKPDWTGSPILYEALVRGVERWRNDGDGWYQADALPGIGLDPETAALLPTLLRKADGASDVPADDPKADPKAARNLEASADKADMPGLVAADGADFTKLTDKVAYAFDDAGRLTRVSALALNTNMTDFDLVIETTISIAYDDVGPLPEPKPALPAEGSK
jgi:hypothetical protein